MLHQTVFKLVMGRVGSRCLDLPKGNRYHSGRIIPNRRVYQREWSRSAGNRTEFKGIVRSSPASVLLLPTVRNCFSKGKRLSLNCAIFRSMAASDLALLR